MIEARNLSKHYKDFVAVQDLSVTVPPGKIIGLLGPNGAGKTTTLRMLAGILKPTTGEIRICGYDLTEEPFEVKRRLGFLSGDTQLYQRLTSREVLRYFGRLHEMEETWLEERIERLVQDLDMGPYADKRIGTLSTGQKQRANVARTILHDPEVLILDEATASLDIISGKFILTYLQQARDEGKAIVFSTHIMGEAEYLCDEIALIYRGRVIYIGTTPEILDRYEAANLTEAFFNAIAEVEEASA